LDSKTRLTDFNFPSNELINLYKCADIFCFPTLIETFGNIYLESMAAGTPIVSTNSPGTRDLLKNNYNGLISEIGDNSKMALDINYLLKDNQLKTDLVNNGQNEVAKYNWDIITKQYILLYSSFLTS